MTKNGWYFLPAFVWGLLIYFIISMPPSSIPDTGLLNIPHIDKAIHFGLFAVFGALLLFGFTRQHKGKKPLQWHVVAGMIIGIVYGAFTEYLQYCCLENRSGNIADFVANGFGTVFGVLIMVLLLKKYRTGSFTIQ